METLCPFNQNLVWANRHNMDTTAPQTNTVEQNPKEASSVSASKDVLHHLWNLKLHYCICNPDHSLRPVSLLSSLQCLGLLSGVMYFLYPPALITLSSLICFKFPIKVWFRFHLNYTLTYSVEQSLF
jgi:hypothetical protein